MAIRTRRRRILESHYHEKLFYLIEEAVGLSTRGLILVGDFNYPYIEWDKYHAHSSSSQMFIECLQKNLLIQSVDFPTRVRGLDTPHLLGLFHTDASTRVEYSQRVLAQALAASTRREWLFTFTRVKIPAGSVTISITYNCIITTKWT